MSFWLIEKLISVWFLPPGCLMVLTGWGVLRLRKHPRSGKALILLSLIALWALSTPLLSRTLLQALEPAPTDPLNILSGPPPQAIVILGGGQYFAAPEFGGSDTVSESTLTRLRYGAHLHRLTGKPILVSGGAPEGGATSEAQNMKMVLEHDFQVPVTWVEAASANTLENARASRAMLAPLGINRVYLVTHAWHMPRSKWIFQQAGFHVMIAPTQYATSLRLTPRDFVPHAYALEDSSHFFHEVIGLLWYGLKSVIR